MEFTEEKAQLLKEQHGLSDQVIRNWRHRDTIPDKYDKESYRPAETAKEDATAQRLREIISLPELAHTAFRAFGKHPNYKSGVQRASDIKRGLPFDEAELRALRAELAELRNKAAKAAQVPTKANFIALMKDKRVHPTKLLSNYLYQKAIEGSGHAPLTTSEKQEVVNLVKLFKSKIQV